MIAVTVTFKLKPGTHDQFLPLMLENARTSLANEASCLQFDVCLGDDPGDIFLYEVYSDAAAFQLHLESPHFKAFDKAISDMVASKQVHVFSEVHR